MTAFYNDTDPYAAAWLRRLIAAGHIAPGVVDERSITDLTPDDLKPFTQLHFFAGLGGWSLALRHAGWPDDRPVWTGSCPCQPFSGSGKGAGFKDARHLWPSWFKLIRACQPPILFGEQVASPSALDWFDLVSSDLERKGYQIGAADLCAAGVGAPHIRQRLWFGATLGRMAHANGRIEPARQPNAGTIQHPSRRASPNRTGGSGHPDRMGHTARRRCRQTRTPGVQSPQWPAATGADVGMGHANHPRPQGRTPLQCPDQRAVGTPGLDGCTPWHNPDWIWCADQKWRPVEPGLSPLADGVRWDRGPSGAA